MLTADCKSLGGFYTRPNTSAVLDLGLMHSSYCRAVLTGPNLLASSYITYSLVIESVLSSETSLISFSK